MGLLYCGANTASRLKAGRVVGKCSQLNIEQIEGLYYYSVWLQVTWCSLPIHYISGDQSGVLSQCHSVLVSPVTVSHNIKLLFSSSWSLLTDRQDD